MIALRDISATLTIVFKVQQVRHIQFSEVERIFTMSVSWLQADLRQRIDTPSNSRLSSCGMLESVNQKVQDRSHGE